MLARCHTQHERLHCRRMELQVYIPTGVDFAKPVRLSGDPILVQITGSIFQHFA